MSKFFGRVFEVIVDDNLFIQQTTGRQFRVTFEILIDYGGFNSYADISFYNLSKDTEQRVFKKDKTIGFKAGYTDSVDFIFKGAIRNVFKERVGPNTITRVIARGGAQQDTSIFESPGKGVTVPTLIRLCAKAMGYPLVINDDDFADVSPYARGYQMGGDPRVHLDKLAQTHSFNYVLENERIVVTGKDSFRAGVPRVISQFNGMEGIPEITEVGCDVSVRLAPRIKIGGRIDVQTELATFNFSNLYFQDVPGNAGKGIYKVFRLRHRGDSWGDAWTTQVTAIR